MIELTETPEVPTVQSLQELYEILLGNYGRVIRVQHTVLKAIHVWGGYAESTSRPERFDRAGTLRELSFFSADDPPATTGGRPIQRASLEISFDSGTSHALTLDRSQIQVLQGDTGEWKVLHRSPNWSAQPAISQRSALSGDQGELEAVAASSSVV